MVTKLENRLLDLWRLLLDACLGAIVVRSVLRWMGLELLASWTDRVLGWCGWIERAMTWLTAITVLGEWVFGMSWLELLLL